jgi:hypothetical protein
MTRTHFFVFLILSVATIIVGLIVQEQIIQTRILNKIHKIQSDILEIEQLNQEILLKLQRQRQ